MSSIPMLAEPLGITLLERVDGALLGVNRPLTGLKRSIATHDLAAGAGLASVQDWLGHTHIQNTPISARLTTGARDAKAGKLFASHRVV
jgi:hypothetical protein